MTLRSLWARVRGWFRRRRAPKPAPFPAPEPIEPPHSCKVVRIVGGKVESLHPGHEFVSNRTARILFENARYAPPRGVVQIIHNGHVRGSHG